MKGEGQEQDAPRNLCSPPSARQHSAALTSFDQVATSDRNPPLLRRPHLIRAIRRASALPSADERTPSTDEPRAPKYALPAPQPPAAAHLELPTDPFAQDFPENFETSIEASALCTRFNPHGTFAGHFLAVGRLDGVVAVLDFETKGIVRWLEGHVKAVTTVW